jgi:hypothetical protein
MAHHKKIMIKNALGQFQCPQPVALAADMMSIGLCEAKAIHSAFQTSKMLLHCNIGSWRNSNSRYNQACREREQSLDLLPK